MDDARWEVATSEDMHALGVRIGSTLAAGDLLVLTGPLGAGKTTLTRGIGEGLGIRGPVQSPTFVIARTHPSLVGGPPLVHVDAYRLGDAREFDDLDLDLDRSVVVVEWGREVAAAVADEWIDIEIARPTGGGGRAHDGGTEASGTEASGTEESASEESGTDESGGPDDRSEALEEPRAVTLRTVRAAPTRG